MRNPDLKSSSVDGALLQTSTGSAANVQLARLPAELLEQLQTGASALQQRAIASARDLLDLSLAAVDYGLPEDHQRGLIERADDELSCAQRWSNLAANARFCLDHPDLARQLAGDAAPGRAADTEADTKPSRPVRRRTRHGSTIPR